MTRYGLSFEKVTTVILRHFREKNNIDSYELAEILGVSPSTAYKWLRLFALKYSDNVEYKRGVLILVKPFSEEDIPLELRYEAQKKTIESLRKAMKEKERILKKLKENHLTHLERALLEQNLEEAEKIIKKMKEELSK